jgi:hypothetical protein
MKIHLNNKFEFKMAEHNYGLPHIDMSTPPPVTEKLRPLYDTFPAEIMGYTALTGAAWWVIPMVLFVKTTQSDRLLQLNQEDSIPI